MGTNYYVDSEGDCPNCTRTHVCQVHLGKSSMGWKFCFALHKELYSNIEELKEWLKGREIRNEYDEPVTYKDFWAMVEAKQKFQDPDTSFSTYIDGYRFIEREFS